jgi:hypothetical protein
MKKYLFFIFLFCTLTRTILAQDIVNDTVCVMPGMPLVYNVTTNDPICQMLPDCSVMLTGQSTCFELDQMGSAFYRPSPTVVVIICYAMNICWFKVNRVLLISRQMPQTGLWTCRSGSPEWRVALRKNYIQRM